MADILHKINIDASGDDVFQALSTIDGLSGWWTQTTQGDSAVGETIEFHFGDHVTGMQVEDLKKDSRVSWRCVHSMADWVGTEVSFDLRSDQGRTTVLFGHRGWPEAGDFFAHCSTKWATFLLSLKSFVETGAGRPFPQDVAI